LKNKESINCFKNERDARKKEKNDGRGGVFLNLSNNKNERTLKG